jgi:O-methyltransferase involved in polyketide biosynthesis
MWEGIIYYLEPESVDATLDFIINASHKESVIAFDYAISISEENINNYYGAKEFDQTWRKHRSGETFRFAVDDGKIESFLEQRGLKIISHLDNTDIENTFLLNDNGLLTGHINGSFRFVSASPNT